MLQILTVTLPLLQLVLGTESSFSSPTRGVQVCPALCSTCESDYSCKVCIANAHLSENRCICDESFYLSSGYCLECKKQACKACNSSENCISCVTHAEKTSGGCECVSGYYWADSRKCDACHETCLQCNGIGVSSCTSCPAGATLWRDHSCQCPSLYFWNSLARICTKCHGTCLTCQNETPQTCLSCPANMKMAKEPPDACFCINGFYLNIYNNDCAMCESSCTTCNTYGPCLSCDPTAKLLSHNCVCERNSFMSGSKCTICDIGCKTCSGRLSSQCTTCPDTFVLKGSSPNTCVCSTGTYLPQGTLRCEPCFNLCRTCKDALAKSCLTCGLGFVLQSSPPSSCVCDTGYFLSGTTCNPCSIMCAGCIGLKSTQCTACSRGAIFTPQKECKCIYPGLIHLRNAYALMAFSLILMCAVSAQKIA